MKEYLSGIEARDQGIADICREIAPDGHRIVVAHEAVAAEDLDVRRRGDRRVDGDGTPLWVYGSTLPRALMPRASKVQVHEPFAADEVPAWFDTAFPRHVHGTSVPGYSCFGPGSLTAAAERMLGEYAGVRLKDPNGASGVGQWSIGSTDEIGPTLTAITAHVAESHDLGLAEYLAEFGFVVEADLSGVEAWSVTVTCTPHGTFSSFGRILEMTVSLEVRGEVQNYGGTSVVVVRGDPEALGDLPADGVAVEDPVRDEEIRLVPAPDVVRAAQRYIEGLRLWESDGAFETRANVDVITGTLTWRDGSEQEIAAAVEDSGRVGGASPAELLGIQALHADPDLAHAVRNTRHSFDSAGIAYARHASTVPGSRIFWNGIDENWDGRYVFIGAF